MILYHGSSTLNPNMKPDCTEQNGAFFALELSFALNFGNKIFEYTIDDSLILDLNNKDHYKKFSSHPRFSELNLDGTYPKAYNLNSDIEMFETLKQITLDLNFDGLIFIEENNFLSVELYRNNNLNYKKFYHYNEYKEE